MRFILSAAILLALSAAPAQQPAPSRTPALTILSADHRQPASTVLAAVVDDRARPIGGLTAGDFVVHVGERPARVLSAATATDPLAIVIVTDGVDLRTVPPVRDAMRQILDVARAQSPAARVGLAAARPGAMLEIASVTEAEDLERAIARFAGSDETWPLLESLLAAADALANESSRRRAVIAISRRHDPLAEPVVATREADALRRAAATLWALDMGWSGVLAEVAPRSGGRHLIARPETLATVARHVMEIVRSQYVITYVPPDGASGAPRVTLRRAGAVALAPSWRLPASPD